MKSEILHKNAYQNRDKNTKLIWVNVPYKLKICFEKFPRNVYTKIYITKLLQTIQNQYYLLLHYNQISYYIYNVSITQSIQPI